MTDEAPPQPIWRDVAKTAVLDVWIKPPWWAFWRKPVLTPKQFHYSAKIKGPGDIHLMQATPGGPAKVMFSRTDGTADYCLAEVHRVD